MYKNYLSLAIGMIFGMGILFSQEETDAGESATEEVQVEENQAEEEELLEYVEEIPGGALSGFSLGFTGSVGFVNGEFITDTPVGGSLVISTPYGFKLGEGLRFNLSIAVGSYTGTALWLEEGADVSADVELAPMVVGLGGNLTLAKFIFAEGHVGTVGDGTGIRGFAGVSLERIMKRSLGLPVNILVGGEGFISTEMKTGYNDSYWGGLGVRLDYSF